MDNNLKYCKTELIFSYIEKKIVENFACQKQMVRKSYPKMQQLYRAVTGEAWPMAAFDIWIYHLSHFLMALFSTCTILLISTDFVQLISIS